MFGIRVNGNEQLTRVRSFKTAQKEVDKLKSERPNDNIELFWANTEERQELAKAAMVAMLSSNRFGENPDILARKAVAQADALIAALNP